MRNILAILLFFSTPFAFAAEIRGKVVNQATGEALGNVAVSVMETAMVTRTSPDGAFVLANVPAGKYTLRVDAVGFWYHRLQIDLAGADAKDLSISLTPQGARRTETVEVTADVFGGAEPAAVSQLTLTSSELKQTDTVLGSDLFRSLQILPGVTANTNNDFFAQPRVLGAPFSTVAVYVDDILVQQPFHGIGTHSDYLAGELAGASLGILNDEMVQSVSLIPLAYSQRYAEGTGGALDVRTREGSRTAPRVGVGIGMAESHVTAEGGIGPNRGSWLLSGRRSYLGYLTRQTGATPNVEPSFSDVDLRLTYDLTRRQSIDLSGILGRCNLDNSYEGPMVEDQLYKGESNFSLAKVGWRFEATPNLLLSARGAYTSSAAHTNNRQANPLRRDSSAEWVGGGRAVWTWKPKQATEVGWTFRRISNSYHGYQYRGIGAGVNEYGANGVGERQSGYVQESTSLLGDRLVLMGSLRWDQYSEVGIHPVSPQISGSLRFLPSTYLLFGAGRYTQFDSPAALAVPCGIFASLVNLSDHYLAGVEQRVGENVRIQVQAFARLNRSRDGIRGGDNAESSVCGPIVESDSWGVEPRSRTQGAELVIQKRSANHLSGWASYTYLRQRSEVYGGSSLGEDIIWKKVGDVAGSGDQKHSVNLFGMYRLRPSLNISGKLSYGSGYLLPNSLFGDPIPVFTDGRVVEKARLDPFFRLDLRADKSLFIKDRKVTLHGEILNVTNHRNMRFIGNQYVMWIDGPREVYMEVRSLGFTPTIGVDFQF